MFHWRHVEASSGQRRESGGWRRYGSNVGRSGGSGSVERRLHQPAPPGDRNARSADAVDRRTEGGHTPGPPRCLSSAPVCAVGSGRRRVGESDNVRGAEDATFEKFQTTLHKVFLEAATISIIFCTLQLLSLFKKLLGFLVKTSIC